MQRAYVIYFFRLLLSFGVEKAQETQRAYGYTIGCRLGPIHNQHPLFSDNKVVRLQAILIFKPCQALSVADLQLLCAFFQCLFSQATYQVWVEPFESVLKLLKLWQDEKLVLALSSIPCCCSKYVQVVVLDSCLLVTVRTLLDSIVAPYWITL